MKMNQKAHRWIGLQNGLFYVLFIAVIVLLGFLAEQFKFEADWTFGNRNSLTASTQTLLKTLDKPLKFVAYIPDDPGLQEQLRKLTAKYQRVKPDTSIEFVNPDLDPARAKQDGVQYAGQLAVHLGDRSEVVDSANEQTLVNVIQRMSRGGERLVVFIEGHGERDPLAQQSTGMSQLVDNLQRNGFKIQPHNLVRTQSIPRNASFVVIDSPQKDWLPGEVDVLKQYVEQGGNLLWLQDPGGLHGLQPLEELLGVQIHTGTVVDANETLQALLGINHPAVIPVVDYGNADIVRKMTAQTLFPFATMVSRDPVKTDQDGSLHWQAQEILMTLPTSWLETSGSLQGSVKFDENSGDQAGPLPLGAVLTRDLEALDAAGGESGKPSPEAKPAGRQQRVVVIGDSDFMLNSFVGLGGNLELATNIFNWLSADDKLLKVKPVRAPDTQLELGETSSFILASLFLFILPVGLVLWGTWNWWRRRRR